MGPQEPIFFGCEMDREIVNNVSALLMPVLVDLGYDLVECEITGSPRGRVLRLYIDTEGGISIGDCERVSRSVGDVLAVENLLPFSYSLEVSSPGLNRPIRKREDFEKFKGSEIHLRTVLPIEGRSNYRGFLMGLDGDSILLSVDGKTHSISIDNVDKARLIPNSDLFGRKAAKRH